MKRIGILGGTFDPPHIGHLIIAQEVRTALELDEVWFIPSSEPPHKHKALIQATDRIEMVEKAISGNAYFKLNTIEVERSGKSYTFDTMKTLTEANPDKTFYFIIGADMVEYLPKWQHIEKLVDMIKFVGVKRKGHQLVCDYPLIKVDIPQVDISSTCIRNRLYNGLSVKYLIPEPVENYIKEHQLYGKK